MHIAPEQLDKQHLKRRRKIIERHNENQIQVNQQALINFASNDYLGISQHPQVKRVLAEAALNHGLGSGSSALICGYHHAHQQLEQQFSQLVDCERSLYFNSGYHANIAVISSMADRHSHVFSDKQCHASLLDGIQLSRAKHYRFRHHDHQQLNEQLQQSTAQQKIIVSESVFSMEGIATDIAQMTKIAEQHKAILIIDDAHGFGIHDIPIAFNQKITLRVTPLGKAGGSLGAMVSGSKPHIEQLLQSARSYRYTTAMPPAIAQASRMALHIIATEVWRRDKLQQNIACFIKGCENADIPLLGLQSRPWQSHNQSPIQCIMVNDNQTALSMQQKLESRGFFVAAIRPPTVETNQARLRISLNTMHTLHDIQSLINALQEAMNDHG